MNSSRVPISQKFKCVAMTMMILCFAASAAAQFEVNPDHFDEQPSSVVSQVTPEQQNIKTRIVEQKRVLDGYYAQILNKSLEVEAIWQDLMAHGTEAGQDLAVSIRQNELEQLRRALAAEISTAEATLADLQKQAEAITTRAQLKPVPPLPRMLPARLRRRDHRGTRLEASARAVR